MTNVKLDEGLIRGDSVSSILDSAMDASGGLLRLTPTRVPRSFLHPGRRIKLHPSDYYRFGADRGGIAERGNDIVGQLDWDKNVDTHFQESNYLEPIVDDNRSGDGFVDKWMVYGTVDGQQLFSAKELTIAPGAKCTLQDPGASSWITVQGRGRMGLLDLQTPAMIRFGENTSDEVYISHVAASGGVEVENLGTEPLVGLRYFGPDTHADLPKGGS